PIPAASARTTAGAPRSSFRATWRSAAAAFWRSRSSGSSVCAGLARAAPERGFAYTHRMTNGEVQQRAQRVLFQNYRQQPIALVRGEGTHVWDADGKRYLDFIGGIATVSFGHANPRLREAVRRQSELLWHASNLYYSEPQIRLAEKLVSRSFADRVFFCNSGAEANEGMIKMARHFHVVNGHPERVEIICMNNAFHGRTRGALAATGQPKYQQGFGPLPAGFRFLEYGEGKAVEAAGSDKT